MSIEQQVRARIAAIPEPCAIAFGAPTTLGDMGLIETIDVSDGHATVTLCLTDSACVHFNAMQRYIADALADLPGVRGVIVRQSLTTLWSPDRMTAA